MTPNIKKEILDLPRAIRETLEMGRPEYDALLRRTRWGESPIYFLGSGSSLPVAQFAAGAFESLLEWPCVVRSALELGADILATARPRSIFFLVSDGSATSELLEVAKAARDRNGTLLALVASPQDALSPAVDGVFVVRAGEERGGVRLPVCHQAAAGYVAFLAARALKRPRPLFDSLEREFAELPGQIEWAFSQHEEGVRSLAAELGRAKKLTILAGGSYYPVAVNVAALLEKLAGIAAETRNAADPQAAQEPGLARDVTLLVLTGSRCHEKKQVHGIAQYAKRGGTKICSLTDGNDSEISRRSALALLLPVLNEITGATLAHAIMVWVASHASRPEAKTP